MAAGEPVVIASRTAAGRWRGIVAVALLLAVLPVRAGAEVGTHGAAQPIGASAEVVPVTAGEHGDFSRVVFALGADRTYRAEPEPAGLRVVFPGARMKFDYGAVYPARRAHRVVMAEPGSDADGASFRLRFGCDCSARTFMLDDRLVVDVFAASSGDERHSSRVMQAVEPYLPAASERLADTAADSAARLAAPGDGGDKVDRAQPRPEFLREVESLSNPAQEPESAAASDGAGFNPDHLQRMIDWAIDHGHLTRLTEGHDQAHPRDEPGDAQAPVQGAATAEAAAPAMPAVQPLVQNPPVAPEPSVAKGSTASASGAADACPEDGALDMAVLGGAGSFAAELARRQNALSRALVAGQGIPAAEHALAGFYLARLMPHEALQLLRSADREASETPTQSWLEAVALVLANRTGASAARPLQASSCRDADVQLWQVVLRAADGPISGQTLTSDAIMPRLASYPADLRVELALRLAEAGIDRQAPEVIARLLAMVEQAVPGDEARARMLFLRGRLAATRGDFAGARASWQEALHLPGEGGFWATLALLESDLEHDTLDEAAALSALEGLAYDWRGHPAQLEVAGLTAAIHERQGQVSLALRAIEEVALGAEGRPTGRAAARLATDLMRRAYADASSALPMDQLAAFWRYEGFVPPGLEGADVRLAFAQALIVHGLPNLANRLLEPLVRNTRGRVHDQVIDLLAEGYVTANQPARALDLLRAGAEDAAAPKATRNLIAARALAALGRFAEAAGVLYGDGGEEAAQLQADYLWKAGLWREATTAYRELLHERQQAQTDPEGAVRLAAAAYMSGQPEPQERTHGVAEAGDEPSAFAALPEPDPAARTVAAQLLAQAANLSGLAERYGIGGTPIP